MSSSRPLSALLDAQAIDCGFEAGHAIVSEADLELRAGEVTALLGPNGSGKSTLLKTLSGLLRPLAGSVRLAGASLEAMSPFERAKRIAYLGADHRAEFPLSAREVIELARIVTPDQRISDEAMALCGCVDLAHRAYDTLSGGERQRVLLARAVAQGAPILLLDEALSKMDLHHQASSGKLLRLLASERGWSIVLVAHDLNLASEWADRCVLLNRGRIVADGPSRETLTPERIGALYPGASLVAGTNPATGAPKIFFR